LAVRIWHFFREPDHFSARLEPYCPQRRQKQSHQTIKQIGFERKIGRGMEQNGAVAAPSQLRTIGAPALPRSNQIEATLFDECR
jgi:hypothetical protein